MRFAVRVGWGAFALLWAPLAGALALGEAARAQGFGGPLPGLQGDEPARFSAGQSAFAEVETREEGLGPVFNEASCATCHSAGAVGGGGARLETRFGRRLGRGFDSMENRGGSLVQDRAIGREENRRCAPEEVPPGGNVISAQRRTTPLFGLGLVEAVPDAVFEALAAAQPPAQRGAVSRVLDLATGALAVGRFGWKAQVPTLLQFAGAAYLNDFMRLLAPPPPGPRDGAAQRGSALFRSAGCEVCHVRELTTGPSEVAALDEVSFQPYSDFLLHDMGSLGDGIEQGSANGRQMRTAPLWGLRAVETFLHDGRTRSLAEAILAHDGQGAAARLAFVELGAADRQALLAFLASL